MGKRKRLHRLAVEAGTEQPFRAGPEKVPMYKLAGMFPKIPGRMFPVLLAAAAGVRGLAHRQGKLG